MTMKNISLHATVGFFVMIGLGCIAYLTLNLANSTLFSRDRYALTARFSAVNGLREGSNVEISGVNVGTVARIDLDQNLYQAVVTMRIQNKVGIPTDSVAAIKTSGLIGDKYISITPGGDDAVLPDNGVILDTQAAIDIEELISKYVFGSVAK